MTIRDVYMRLSYKYDVLGDMPKMRKMSRAY
jgi:hypothetical protein